jgi:hypothetical protein
MCNGLGKPDTEAQKCAPVKVAEPDNKREIVKQRIKSPFGVFHLL